MEHDDRVRRLNILLGTLPVQAEIDDTDAYLDQWESALVRAAAEITGLTTEWANWAQTCVLTEHTGEEDDRADDCPECGLALAALRRYAELAK